MTSRDAGSRGAGLAVSLRGVGRVFAAADGPVPALEAVDLEVAAGEFVALLGPSGCGKSTLLRLVAGLDRPDEGRVLLGDDGPGEAAGALACVFQDAHLLPWRDVLGNVELPLELRGIPRERRRAAAQAAVEQVGLADAMGRTPAQLSGGMRMRASLARALVTRPRLLLLDEPFAALDEFTRQALDQELHELWRTVRFTVVFVTHSIAEAAFLAQRAVVLSRRPSRIVCEHRLDLPEQRCDALRTEARFARELRVLQNALRQEGAAA